MTYRHEIFALALSKLIYNRVTRCVRFFKEKLTEDILLKSNRSSESLQHLPLSSTISPKKRSSTIQAISNNFFVLLT